MLFLTAQEKQEWQALADEALAKKSGVEQLTANVRSNLAPMFNYYLGAFLAAKGQVELGRQWHDLFADTLAPDFNCLCDSACYADEYTGLFTMHYGH